MITQERLKEVLDYNPETGVFTWRVSPSNNTSAGSEAGSPDEKGYIKIKIRGSFYQDHRLAILYTDGYWPENTVDHKDRVPWHNWRSNLREASHQCQNRNCGMRSDNTSGVKGVSWSKKRGKWCAQIAVDSQQRHLGLLGSRLDAAYARYAAEQCLGFPDCDANSSAKNVYRQGGEA